MTKLEESNITTQNVLMNDIIHNYKSIIYDVTKAGEQLNTLLSKKTYKEEDKTVVLSREHYDAICDLARTLSIERSFDKLGILSKNALPDNTIKLDILERLRK